MGVWVSLDNEPCVTKPCGREIPAVKRRTAGRWQEIELERLADLNGNKGHAVTRRILSEGYRRPTVLKCSCLCLILIMAVRLHR